MFKRVGEHSPFFYSMAERNLIDIPAVAPGGPTCLLRIDIPDNVDWKSIIIGAIARLKDKGVFDEETGNIDDAHEIIDDILHDFSDNCF